MLKLEDKFIKCDLLILIFVFFLIYQYFLNLHYFI